MLGWTLFIFGFVGLLSNLFWAVPWLYSVYSLIGAIFFMIYLAIDVQLLMGGKRYTIDPEDYIFERKKWSVKKSSSKKKATQNVPEPHQMYEHEEDEVEYIEDVKPAIKHEIIELD